MAHGGGLFERRKPCRLVWFGVMQAPLPEPTASGSLIKTPFPHLLVYALERRLSGTFELSRGAQTVASFLVIGGCPAKVRLLEPGLFLGQILSELGMIRPDQLQASHELMQSAPRLQGQALLELGALDPPTLDAGLRAQVERKVEHLFTLPNDATFAYYDNVDLLQGFGGAPTPIDPFPVLWRGVREAPAWEHVDATLRRIGSALVRANTTAQLERFMFGPQEREIAEILRQRPMRMLDVTGALGPSVGQVFVYFLMIMKQVDLVDPAVGRPATQTPMVAPPSQPGLPASPPSSAQAFARVQLTRQAARNPGLIVEEVVASSYDDDERASRPGQSSPPSAFSAPPPESRVSIPPPIIVNVPAPPAGPLDLGIMIAATIQQSSMPPAMGDGPSASIPPAATLPKISMPPPADDAPPASSGTMPPPSGRPLTAEQNALKTKILERADQITSQNYFQMLGIERDAGPELVQKAFFGLAKVWHPDRLPPALVDVKDACSKVFTHLTEAHATLMDPTKRSDYMTLIRDGGATPEDQQKIQAILEAATEFQKAEFLLKRNLTDMAAYEIVKRCVALDGEQADYLATLAWLDAQKPEWLSREKTLEKTLVLDRCIARNPNSERAFFYRGLLFKRAEEQSRALKDFKRAAELNPRNLDAMREVRLYNMRGGNPNTVPPPKGATEKVGGLFGKLFKK